MDEIKYKVINFVKKQGISASEQSKLDAIDDEEAIRNSALIRTKPVEEKDEVELEDEEVLQQIPLNYFDNTQDFDIQYHILKELPEKIECSEIKTQLKSLYRQHAVVSKRILRLIIEKETACKSELGRISELQDELAIALSVCRGSRLHLNGAKNKFTIKGLNVLKCYKRKQIIHQLLNNLKTIRTLQRSDERLQELLEEGDFSGAILLLLESQSVALTLKHYKCVAQLSWKLQDTLETTEGQLDIALSKMCRSFDEAVYAKLQKAYSLLDKTQTVMDQLLMHFTSELHSSLFKVVHGYTMSSSTKQFQSICECVPDSQFIPCLQALCQEVWYILNSYYKVHQWHQRHDRESPKTDMGARDFERNLNLQYVKQKLENGQTRLWNDVQSRISLYVLGHDFSIYKIEELLQILGVLHRLMEIGEELCGSKSEELSKCVRQQTVSFFQSYHASKLEELRIFLENEAWTPCPVRPKFNLLYLQEFKCLRHSIESHRAPKRGQVTATVKDETRDSCSNLSTGGSSSCQNANYFSRFSDEGNPFDSPLEETYQEDILDNIGEDLSGYYSSDDSDNEELKKAFVEETPGHDTGRKKEKEHPEKANKPGSPILSNTTLTVLRQCGKYLQMCRLLKPIALDVIICMCQLFDYYLYNVYHFFTSDLTLQSTSMVTFKLQATLKRIEENLILKSNVESSQDSKRKVVPSTISEMVNLHSRESLYGLSERVVAVESLIFLGSQFEYIQKFVLHLVPEEKRHFVDQFYSQTVICTADMRRVAYMCVSGHVVDMHQTVKDMCAVNFDVKEVTSEHSPYVDKIVRDMQLFSMKLEDFELDIPLDAEKTLWENILHVVNSILVEGFSFARKCSNGGRALMLLDYTQLISKVQKLRPQLRIPNKEYVEGYIKAFYLQESMLEEWILQHREYTPKQLEGLVHSACYTSKKTKQRLLQLLEAGK